VLDVAASALEGSDPRKTRKYWDHRYIYTDERGILHTVCFVVNDVLASLLRDRSDKDGSKAILCETNIMACIKCRNPTEQGCRAEEIAVTAISRGDCALFRCIIQDPPRTITTTHFDTTDDVTQPVGQSLRRPLRAACFQLRAHRLFAEGAHIRERQV
jgi:hypothetical protein